MEWVPEDGNIFIRRNRLERPGNQINGHAHKFWHLTVLWQGKWHATQRLPLVDQYGKPIVQSDGQPELMVQNEIEVDGPHYLPIRKGVWHDITYIGNPVPDWMKPFLSQLPPDQRAAFTAKYEAQHGIADCLYSHRNPQGEVIEHYDGWMGAYE